MPATVLVGTQWGDEGKGKITDLITSGFDIVCRFQGGANAGHTVQANGRSYGLHQMPSGVMVEGVMPVVGNGCIVDPEVLLGEVDMLEADGVDCSLLRVSGNAHVVMPWHKDLDGAIEEALGERSLGTTKRGIGPCYAHKMGRTGIRIQDMLDDETFRRRVGEALVTVNVELASYGCATYEVDQVCDAYLPMCARLRPYIAETSGILNECLERGGKVLFEGAQATMLDIDHGTYPFVTSSNCTAGGAVTGSGVGPTNIERVLGVVKAYTTRVGEGPLPTEQPEGTEVGDTLCEVGHEYGVTTGRRRRCGWYDACLLTYAKRVNGLTHVAITKLDVLGAFDTIKICVAYDIDGVRYETVPEHEALFERAEPVYEEMPGWKCDISDCRTFEELPREAQDYVRRLAELGGVTPSFVAVGPDREQTITIDWE